MRETVTLVQAAAALRRGYHATLGAVLRGELIGWQDERRRWVVDAADLQRLCRERALSGRVVAEGV